MKIKKIIAAGILSLLLAILTACSSGSASSASNSGNAGNSSASRCQPASAAQLAAIRAGVQGVQASNDIRTGFAVRSRDFERVWMVAAKLYGPGIPATGAGPGVWSIAGDPASPNMILSVDGFAQAFSDYPDASKTKAAITQSADGVDEARACANR